MSFFLFVLWNFTFTLGRNNGEMFKILYKQRRIYIYVSPCFRWNRVASEKRYFLRWGSEYLCYPPRFVECILGTRLQAVSLFFSVGRAKRARHDIDQAYDGRREMEERLLAIYLGTKFSSLSFFNLLQFHSVCDPDVVRLFKKYRKFETSFLSSHRTGKQNRYNPHKIVLVISSQPCNVYMYPAE